MDGGIARGNPKTATTMREGWVRRGVGSLRRRVSQCVTMIFYEPYILNKFVVIELKHTSSEAAIFRLCTVKTSIIYGFIGVYKNRDYPDISCMYNWKRYNKRETSRCEMMMSKCNFPNVLQLQVRIFLIFLEFIITEVYPLVTKLFQIFNEKYWVSMLMCSISWQLLGEHADV